MNPPAQPVDFPHPPQASELGRPRRPPGPPSPARIRRRQEEDRGDRSRPAGAPIPKACTTPPPTGPAAKPAAARLSGWEAIALPFVARGRFRVVGTLGGGGAGGGSRWRRGPGLRRGEGEGAGGTLAYARAAQGGWAGLPILPDRFASRCPPPSKPQGGVHPADLRAASRSAVDHGVGKCRGEPRPTGAGRGDGVDFGAVTYGGRRERSGERIARFPIVARKVISRR